MGMHSRKQRRDKKLNSTKSLQIHELENRSVPTVLSTLLANGTLAVTLNAPNDAADISVSGGQVIVTGGVSSARFATGSVHGLTINGDFNASQTARVSGKMDLPNGLNSIDLERFTLDTASLTAGSANVVVGGPVDILGSGLSGTGAVLFQSTSTVSNSKAVALIGAVADSSAVVTVTNSSISGSSVQLKANSTVSATAAADNQEDTNRDLARVQTTADARVTIDGTSSIAATGAVTIAAETKTTASAAALAKATNGDSTRDAAIAFGRLTTFAAAEITGTSTVSAGGAFVLSAKNDIDSSISADGTAGGSGAAGGSIARTVLDNQTRAIVSGQVKVNASTVDVLATTTTANTTTAKSTTGGATANDTSTQQQLADDGAVTNEGGINLAGAVAVNRFNRNDSLASISSTGGVTATRVGVVSKSTADANATADGSATGGGLGVGVAVAIDRGSVQNRAFLGSGSVLNSPTIVVEASNPESSDTKATATSGAGGKNVGFAGSFARTAVDHLTEAFIPSTLNSVSIIGADLTLRASDVSTNTPTAVPFGVGGTGDKFGFGASVAMAAGNHTVRSGLNDGAGLIGADDVIIQAIGNHTTNVNATTGAEGGIAFTPGVATALGTNSTSARLGIGSNLAATGNVSISSNHTGTTSATTKADATGSKAALGGSFALTDVIDTSDASVSRSASVGGSLTVNAISVTDTKATAFASANGANDTKLANEQAAQQKVDPTSPSLETAAGKLGVAAALGLNLSNARSSSVLGGVTVIANGAIDVSTSNKSTAAARGDGTAAIPATNFGTGVGIALNAVEARAEARLDPAANIAGGSFRLNADTGTGHTFNSDASAGAGAKNFAIAGAVAIDKITNSTSAVLRGGSTVSSAGLVSITANDISTGNTTAGQLDNGPTATKLGFGATVAVGAFFNTTRAEVEDNARLSRAGTTSISATSNYTHNTTAKGGAGTDASNTAFVLAPTVAASAPTNTTLARIGTPPLAGVSSIQGDFSVLATHTGKDTTSAAGTTVASKAGFGVSLALDLGTDDVFAKVNRVVANGNTRVNADANVTHQTDAQASARGGQQAAADSNNMISVETKQVDLATGKTTSSFSNVPPAKAPDANSPTQENNVIVGAGAISVTATRTNSQATIENGGFVQTAFLSLRSGLSADRASKADASTVDPTAATLPQGIGLAAAVAITSDTTNNDASVGSSASVLSRGLSVEAGPSATGDPTSTASTVAVSGSGGTNLGVAGAFAVTVANRSTTAKLGTFAQLDLGTGASADDLIVNANSNSATIANATGVSPFVAGGSSKVGIGGSFAVAVGKVDTQAVFEANVNLMDTNDATVSATTNHTATATTDSGASGGTAISPAISLVVAPTNTLATAGSGSPLSLTGNLTIRSDSVTASTTRAGAQASGLSAAVGTPIAVTIAEDISAANLARNVTLGGGLTLFNHSDSTPNAIADATSKGGTDRQDGDSIADRARAYGNELRATSAGNGAIVGKLRSGLDQLNAASKKHADTNGDTIGVAAAAAFTLGLTDASALIGTGTTVTAVGHVIVRSDSDGKFSATANGIAGGTSTDTAVGAAAAAVLGIADNRATIAAGADVTGGGITVDATGDRDFISLAASKAGGTKAGVAGSLAVNIVDVDTQALAGDSSKLTSTGGISITSASDTDLRAAAGGGAIGLSERGIGAAVAGNIALTNTSALLGVSTTANATGALLVSSSGSIGELDGPFTVAGAPTAAAVSGSLGKSARAASLAAEIVSDKSTATIGNGSRINTTTVGGSGQTVSVIATNQNTLKAAAGTAVIGATATQFGLGAAVEVVDSTTEALIGTGDIVNAGGAITIAAEGSESLSPIAAGGALSAGSALNGAVGVAVTSSSTRATANGVVNAGGNLAITAKHATIANPNVISISGGVSNVAGAAASVVVTKDTVEAMSTTGSTLTTGGATGLTVTATQTTNVSPIVAGGGGAGRVGVAGSGSVSDIRETTLAHIDGFVTATNKTLGIDPGIKVEAKTNTTVLGVAGAAAGGGTAGIGAGADVTVLNVNNQAWVGGGVSLTADGNVTVNAESFEDLTSVAATAGGGGTVGVAGSAGVLVVDVITRSLLGSDPQQQQLFNPSQIAANGSIVVTADDNLEADILAGGLVGSGSVAVGGSAAIPVINQTTEAIIASNANVVALGQTVANGVRLGDLTTSFRTNSASNTEVKAPTLAFRDANGDGINDLSNPALTLERDATPLLGTARGVLVSATNRTDVETIALGLGGSGGLAINIGTPVSVLSPVTRALIGSGASVLAGNGTSPADTSVTVAAASDTYLLAIGAAGTGSGGVAGSAVAGFTGVRPTTEARIASSSQVAARDDVSVKADTNVDAIALTAGAGVSGGVSVAGSADVLSITETTIASISQNSSVTAGDTVRVLANDDTKAAVVAGAAGVGIGFGGIGASVGVLLIQKDTSATIADNATVVGNATGFSKLDTTLQGVHGVEVNATSTEDILNIAAAGGGGFLALAGGVSVTVVDSDTDASIGAGAKINQTGTNVGTAQTVAVNADNSLKALTVGGGLAGGAGALGGGIDVGRVKSDTTSSISGNAQIRAAEDVRVLADATRDVTSVAASGAGGVVALNSSVSFWDFDSAGKLNPVITNDSGEAGQAISSSTVIADSNGNRADTFAATQQEQASGQTKSALQSFEGSTLPLGTTDFTPSQRLGFQVGRALSRSALATPSGTSVSTTLTGTHVPVGTSATVATGATIIAGGDLDVAAKTTNLVNQVAGGASGGVVAAGASVAVLKIATPSTVRFDGIADVGGMASIAADARHNTNSTGLGGQVGFVALGAAVANVDDTTAEAATIGSTGEIRRASQLNLSATSLETLDGTVKSIGVGVVAAGASFATVLEHGSTKSLVDFGAKIGQTTGLNVGGVSVNAHPTIITTSNVTAGRAGIGVGLNFNFSRSEATTDTEAIVAGNARIKATNDVTIDARGDTTANAESFGVSVAGGVAFGRSRATAIATPNILAKIDPGATLAAGQDVQVRTFGVTEANAESRSGSGGLLVGSDGSTAIATAKPVIKTEVRNSANDAVNQTTSISAARDLFITVDSVANANANSGNVAVGLLVGRGTATATAETLNAASATIAGGSSFVGPVSIVAGRDVTIETKASQTASGNANAIAASAIPSSDAIVNANANYLAETNIGDNTSVNAGGNIAVRTLIPLADADAIARANGNGIVAGSTADARARVGTADFNAIANANIGSNANLQGNAITVSAITTVTEARSDAQAFDTGAGGGGLIIGPTTSIAGTHVRPETRVLLGGTAILNAANGLSVNARNDGLTGATNAFSDDLGRDNGTAATAISTLDNDAIVLVNSGVQTTSRTLVVVADTDVTELTAVARMDNDGIFSNGTTPGTQTKSNLQIESITYSGTSTLLGAPNPELQVDRTGLITRAVGVTASNDGRGNLVVAPISYPMNGTLVQFTAGSGVNANAKIDGSGGEFHFVRTPNAITIDNNSALNLVLDAINVIGTGEPRISLSSDNVPITFQVFHDYNPTAVTISSTGSLRLNGSITNPIGTTSLISNAGNITGTGTVETQTLNLSAPNGFIGTAATPLSVALVRANLTPEINATAGTDIDLFVAVRQRQTLLPGIQLNANLNLTAGDDINLQLGDGVVQTTQPTTRPTVQVVEPLNSRTSTVIQFFRPPVEEFPTPLPLGVFGQGTTTRDTSFAVNANAAGDLLVQRVGTRVARLSGNQTLNAVGPRTLNGLTVSPGTPTLAGSMRVAGSLPLNSSDTVEVQLNGLIRGSQFDAIDVTGTVVLNGASLVASANFVPALGTRFKIIDNDGTDAVVGTFANLPANGASITINGAIYTITYSGGDGNDVELIRNSPSAFPNRSISPSVENGLTYLTGDIVDADATDTFQLTINWGDGTTEVHTFAPGTRTVTLTHRYLDNRPDGTPYPVRLEWRDPHGGGNIDTLSAVVTNAPPVVNGGPDLVTRTGRVVRISPAVTDASPIDTVSVVWTVRDDRGRIIARGFGPEIAFQPHGPGLYFVTITATDDDGGVGQDVVVVTVTNGSQGSNDSGSESFVAPPVRPKALGMFNEENWDELSVYGVFVGDYQ